MAELRAEVLRADLERLGRYDGHRVRQQLRNAFAPEHTWGIEVGCDLAGCVALRPANDAHRLEHLYLDPNLQGRGIGSAVLRLLVERCDRDGTRTRLNVLRDSRAQRLYERHGFGVESEDPMDVVMVREPAPVTGSTSATCARNTAMLSRTSSGELMPTTMPATA